MILEAGAADKSLQRRRTRHATKGAVRTTSMVLLVIGCAACFGCCGAELLSLVFQSTSPEKEPNHAQDI